MKIMTRMDLTKVGKKRDCFANEILNTGKELMPIDAEKTPNRLVFQRKNAGSSLPAEAR